MRVITPTGKSVEVKRTHRVFFAGHTGSGKTWRALRMLSVKARLIALDPKHEVEIPDAQIVSKFDPRIPRQIFRAPAYGRKEAGAYEQFLFDVWNYHAPKKLPVTVYVDEVNYVNPGPRTMNAALDLMIRQGRSKSIAVWTASQRPADIPSTIFTECEHIFSYHLTFEPDREKVEKFTRDGLAELIDSLPPYHAVYYGPRTRQIELLPPMPAEWPMPPAPAEPEHGASALRRRLRRK